MQQFALLGTAYVYPRTTNKFLEAYLIGKGIPKEDNFVNYTPFGHSDEVTADTLPVVAFSVGEEKPSGLDTANLAGRLAAWNDFMTADTAENAAFIAAWKAFIKDDARVTNDPMEAHCIGFNMWVNAVTAAGTTRVDTVSAAMIGQEFPNLTGAMSKTLPTQHLTKPVLIGEIRADGQFEMISQTEPVPGDAWTDFLPEPAVLEADWANLNCAMYNTETKSCIQMTSNC